VANHQEKEKQYQMESQMRVNRDDYIVEPALNVVSEPMTDSEREFQQIMKSAVFSWYL
jgi:hypothetical protein